MAFMDLTEAFDTVNRDLHWAVPLRVACLQRFVNILQSFHKGMMAQVTTGGQESTPSKVHSVPIMIQDFHPALFRTVLNKAGTKSMETTFLQR